jgi:pimeloyl-ACP methyl ester carboxylesterase
LGTAGIVGPYVIAGHSYGGLVARAFADLYPNEVVGLVLVDASHPGQWTRIPAALGGRVVAASNRFLGLMADVGLMRILDPITPQVAAGLPAREFAEMTALFALPKMWTTSSATLASGDGRSRPQIEGARSLGDLPLAVISVTEQAQYGETLTALQAELPALSSNSIHDTVDGATHEGLVSNREHATVVAQVIRRVVEATRTGQRMTIQ